MANPSKSKGTDFESQIILPYVQQFWPKAYRPALSGSNDIGDIVGTPLNLELKAITKQLDLPGWHREAAREAEKANQPFIPVVHKRVGSRDGANQWVSIQMWQLVDFLKCWEAVNA